MTYAELATPAGSSRAYSCSTYWDSTRIGRPGTSPRACSAARSPSYFRPFLEDGQVSEMLPLAFALLGVAFAAWTLFACAVAAFTGTLFRRTLPAMAVTLVVYIALAIATATTIRPHYATPVTEPGWNGKLASAG
jgi:hypothetical protein